MYAIIWYVNDDYVTFLHNENGSIRLFSDLNSANIYAGQIDKDRNNARAVSLSATRR